ncbi:tetratricopeptide repeat protein [Amycolatopsis balhimycina]|nr:tetratricopeptide repeat protein [Amycolatopsis balhimycina]
MQPMPVTDYVPRREEAELLAEVARVRSTRHSGVLLIYGVGGVGKTKMVRALARRGGPDRHTHWITPIDIDDSEFWLLENLQRVVAEELDPEAVFFSPFLTYLSQLPQYSARRIGRDTIASHHRRMRELFVQCYTDFVEKTGATVVITLDTVETIRSTYLLITLTQWMRRLPATLFVLSGRPATGWGGRDPIREHLDDPRNPLPVTEMELHGFGHEDAVGFLDASVLGDSLTAEQKEHLADLTAGHPLWLALAVDYLQRRDPPPEMAEEGPCDGPLRENFRRRLVTPYRSANFWSEAIKRLAVVRHSIDQRVWGRLMDDQDLPDGVGDWDQAWTELCRRPWIRRRANARYVTLHDALAEELCLRLIPLHDLDETWRHQMWRRASDAYESLVGAEYEAVVGELSTVFDTGEDPDNAVFRRVAELDIRKREFDQLRTAALYYRLLSDFEGGTELFLETFSTAAAQHDLHFQELACHELERFLPPASETALLEDAVGVVIERFRSWLVTTPLRYLDIGIRIAQFLTNNAQPRAALSLLDRLPEDQADADLRYRLANERGNAWMGIPGEVELAKHHFDLALEYTDGLPSPDREHRRAQAYKELGYYTRNLGRWQQADTYYHSAYEVIAAVVGPGRPSADREELASIQANWAYLRALHGQYDDARNLIEAAIAVRRRLGSDHQLAVSYSVSGEIYRYERKFTLAWKSYAQAETCFSTLRNWPWIGMILQEQAICLFQAHQSGYELLPDPVTQAKQIILRSLEICRDYAIRWYPSALNRAGRIFGDEDPDTGLDYLDKSVTEATRVADGWFVSAGLIEYMELVYEVWTRTRDPRYRALIRSRVADIERAIEEYDYTDLEARWELLQGHLILHDNLDGTASETLDDALTHYSVGFRILADRRVGSHGAAAIASEFERFHQLFSLLSTETQVRWYARLREDWSTKSRSTSLLARLEQLY